MLDRAEIEKATDRVLHALGMSAGRPNIDYKIVRDALISIAKRAFEQAALGTNPLSVNLAALNTPTDSAKETTWVALSREGRAVSSEAARPTIMEDQIMGRLSLQRQIGAGEMETIIVTPNGDEIRIGLMPKTGVGAVKITIEAPREYQIYREEIYDRSLDAGGEGG